MTENEIREWADNHWSEEDRMRYTRPFEDVLTCWSNIKDVVEKRYGAKFIRELESRKEWLSRVRRSIVGSGEFFGFGYEGTKPVFKVAPACYVVWEENKFVVKEDPTSYVVTHVGTHVLSTNLLDEMKHLSSNTRIRIVLAMLYEVLVQFPESKYLFTEGRQHLLCYVGTVLQIPDRVLDTFNWGDFTPSESRLGWLHPRDNETDVVSIMGNDGKCAAYFYSDSDWLYVGYAGKYDRYSCRYQLLPTEDVRRQSAQVDMMCIMISGALAQIGIGLTNTEASIHWDDTVVLGERPNHRAMSSCGNMRHVYRALCRIAFRLK